MAYERTQLKTLLNRVNEKRRFIQVLSGPRQVGKTTLLSQLQEMVDIPVHFVSSDNVSAPGKAWVSQQWEIARFKSNQAASKESLLIIDEIQKIPDWSEVVKEEWDSDSRHNNNVKVILSGSSRLMLQQGLKESLAGRFETTTMLHWSFTEMKTVFGWTPDQYAWFGGYPGSADLIADEPRWKKYVSESLLEATISKDILMLTRVDKPALMRRLFEIGCLYTGQFLSFTKILGQLDDAGNTTTLAHYLKLLDSAGLLGGLEKYSRAAFRSRGSSPKFIVHNTALIGALQSEDFSEIRAIPDRWGRVVESVVGAHLMNYAKSENVSLCYWNYEGHEVDFVLSKGSKTIAIEVKSGRTGKLNGMDAFRKQFNPDKVLLVGTGGLPWEEFIAIDIDEIF